MKFKSEKEYTVGKFQAMRFTSRNSSLDGKMIQLLTIQLVGGSKYNE